MSNIVYFWGKEDMCSNFYPVTYNSKNGQQYCCSEQEYMHKKALYFGDIGIAEKILLLTDPVYIKKAGRMVTNFNQSTWDNVKQDIMKEALTNKFKVPFLRDYMLNTPRNTIFVEASPYDKEWGIGLSASQAKKVNQSDWPGKNLLGKLLTNLQESLWLERNQVSWETLVRGDSI